MKASRSATVAAGRSRSAARTEANRLRTATVAGANPRHRMWARHPRAGRRTAGCAVAVPRTTATRAAAGHRATAVDVVAGPRRAIWTGPTAPRQPEVERQGRVSMCPGVYPRIPRPDLRPRDDAAEGPNRWAKANRPASVGAAGADHSGPARRPFHVDPRSLPVPRRSWTNRWDRTAILPDADSLFLRPDQRPAGDAAAGHSSSAEKPHRPDPRNLPAPRRPAAGRPHRTGGLRDAGLRFPRAGPLSEDGAAADPDRRTDPVGSGHPATADGAAADHSGPDRLRFRQDHRSSRAAAVGVPRRRVRVRPEQGR